MSRLKREGNPPTGQLASPVPQAWDPSINDFREITGQNLGGGRFGTDGVQWGKAASGLFVPIRVTNDGTQEVKINNGEGEPVPVQLSGNIAPLVKIYERTFSSQSGTLVDHCYGENVVRSDGSGIIPLNISNYSDVFVKYTNNTDQTRRIFLYILHTTEVGTVGVTSGNYLLSKTIVPAFSKSIPAGTTIYLYPLRDGNSDNNIAQLNLGGIGFAFRLLWSNASDVTTGKEELIAVFK